MGQVVSVDVLQALADAFGAHDLDRFMAYVADDCVLEMPRGPFPFGSRFVGLPDVHYGNLEHFMCGDTGISKWLLTGTTPVGVRIEVRGCDFYSFRDGNIIKMDSYWKILEP